jgi:3-deoxy-D-manno-octulosonic-acid transferase
MSRFFYSLLLYALLPFTPLKLLWRGMRQPEYRQHLAERYGFYATKPQQPVIWLHCVSLGETRAAAPLVQVLMTQYPQHRILLTHATPTGREAGEQLFGNRVDRVYLPYDTPDAVARFLDHFCPAIGLLLETELWFNLIAGCKARNIPLLLVNARLSEKSAKGYARAGNLTRLGLRNLAAIAAQTEQDAARFRQLGAEGVTISGNLKFDVKPSVDAERTGLALRQKFGVGRPVFLAASTRDGEEALILDAIQQVHIPGLLVVIVPRHPQRNVDVAELLNQRGISFMRKTTLSAQQAEVSPECEVVLGDTMGEMFMYYAACDLALIGGSLLPFGGQNLIEACAMKKPVIVGQHTYNFEWVANEAIRHGGARRVNSSAELTQVLRELFSDEEARQKMGLAAYAFSQSAGGATYKTLQLIAEFCPAP